MSTKWMTEPEAAEWLFACRKALDAACAEARVVDDSVKFRASEFDSLAKQLLSQSNAQMFWAEHWADHIDRTTSRYAAYACFLYGEHARRRREAARGVKPTYLVFYVGMNRSRFWTGPEPRWLILARAYSLAAAVLRSMCVADRPYNWIKQGDVAR